MWEAARDLLRERLAAIGVDEVEIDEAGNLWARLPGRRPLRPGAGARLPPRFGPGRRSARRRPRRDGGARRPPRLGRGRRSGRLPPRDLVLIDFADEEGSRFGRSLFGSSALAGTLDPAALAGLTDADGEPIGPVLAAAGVELEGAPRAHAGGSARSAPTSSSTSSRARCSKPRAMSCAAVSGMRRRRAPPPRPRRPGLACRDDADGPAPRRRARGGRDRRSRSSGSPASTAASAPPAASSSSRA